MSVTRRAQWANKSAVSLDAEVSEPEGAQPWDTVEGPPIHLKCIL